MDYIIYQYIPVLQQPMSEYSLPPQPRTRRPGKCRLCQKTGHNIRSCKLYENVRRDSVNKYMEYLYHCIVGFATKNWDYTTVEIGNREEDPYCKPSEDLLEMFQNALQTETPLNVLLEKPLKLLHDLDDLSLKALTYGYQIDFRASREDIILLLHYVLISEADYKWMHSYEIKYCVPYIIHSSTYLSILENNNAKIFDFSILFAESLAVAGLYDLPYRNERLRNLYQQSQLILRSQTREIRRQEQRLADLDRSLERIELDIISVASFRDNTLIRANYTREELLLFPEEIVTMKSIQIVQEKQKVDQLRITECPICYELLTDDSTTKVNCGHYFCSLCILNTIVKKFDIDKHDIKCDCPLCRTPIQKLFGQTQQLQSELKYIVRTNRIPRDIYDSIG